MLKQTINSILAVSAIATAFSVITLPLSVSAQNTTVTLNVSAGVLTMYAGDAINNNDICTPADDGDTIEGVLCGANERTIALSGLSTTSNRQNTTSTIHDVLFEDLRGFATSTYSVTATVSNFVDGAKIIALGTNPDGATEDNDPDAPTAGDANKLFAVIDPSVGTIDTLRPAAAEADQVNYTAGPRSAAIISNATSTTIFGTTTASLPSRTEIDGTIFKLRVPAFVQAGNYTGTITFTVT